MRFNNCNTNGRARTSDSVKQTDKCSYCAVADQDSCLQSGELEDDVSLYSDTSSYCSKPSPPRHTIRNISISDIPATIAPGPPSILDYKYENGRRYHAFREGSYLMPNDEREQERLALAHQIYKAVVNGALYRAPLPPNPRRVLDIGTGTGIWAIELYVSSNIAQNPLPVLS